MNATQSLRLTPTAPWHTKAYTTATTGRVIEVDGMFLRIPDDAEVAQCMTQVADACRAMSVESRRRHVASLMLRALGCRAARLASRFRSANDEEAAGLLAGGADLARRTSLALARLTERQPAPPPRRPKRVQNTAPPNTRVTPSACNAPPVTSVIPLVTFITN